MIIFTVYILGSFQEEEEKRKRAYPVDENVFGKARIGVLNTTETIHDLPAVQLLDHLLQTTIWKHKPTVPSHTNMKSKVKYSSIKN